MKFRYFLLVSAVLFCTASISASTLQHTFVSRSGSDSNSCTALSPCLTFAYALNNTSSGGIITVEDAGDYGPMTIWQPVTIDGSNLGSVTFTGIDSYGIRIAGSGNVTLQNLTISGVNSGGTPIYVENGAIVTVDNCKLTNFTNLGIFVYGPGTLTVKNSQIENFVGVSLRGIQMMQTGENLVVKNTVIDASPFSAGNLGIYIWQSIGSFNASLQNVTIIGAGAQAVLAQSGVTEITGSVITQGGTGVYASNGATVSVASSMITANTTGVCSYPSSKIRLDNNDIYDNATAIANCGGIVKTSTTNKTSGTIAIPAADVSESVTF